MWPKVKAALRSAKARTQEALCDAIAQSLADVRAEECRNFFSHCFV
jgi:hypothetical protein